MVYGRSAKRRARAALTIQAAQIHRRALPSSFDETDIEDLVFGTSSLITPSPSSPAASKWPKEAAAGQSAAPKAQPADGTLELVEGVDRKMTGLQQQVSRIDSTVRQQAVAMKALTAKLGEISRHMRSGEEQPSSVPAATDGTSTLEA